MRGWKVVLALLLAVGVAVPTLATFHLISIVQVFAGTPAAPQAQYFMLQSYSFGQDQLAGHTYEIYNTAGTLTEAGVFAENVGNAANQMNILLATSQAESFFNVSADVVIPAELIAAGGKVCFNNGIDCFAWGSFAGGGCGVGPAFNATTGGLHPGRAAKRRFDVSGDPNLLEATDDTNNCSTDFVEGLPAPRNNSNVLGTIPPSTCGNGAVEGVEQCDDHNTGNGDGCSSTCTTEAGGSPPVLSIGDVSTSEGNSGTKTLNFTVSLSKTSTSAVSYNIATANGTATAGSDYVANSLSGQSIPAGQTSKPFAVTINGDTAVEANETFTVTVSGVSGASVGDGSAVGSINNDDAPALSIANVSTSEGNSGSKTLSFTVALSAPASGAVSYNIATSNGTATAGSDYVASSLSGQSIPAGQTSKPFAVTINGDTVAEPNETLIAAVGGVVGASVADGAAVGTINNDDAPALSIADVSTSEGNSGTKTLSFTVALSAPPPGPVTYNIATSNGTATAGSDYVSSSLPGQSIPAGQTSKPFAVTINGDAIVEANETLIAAVSGVSGATIADSAAVGTINNDDTGPPTLTIADVATSEGNSGTKTLSFSVALSAPASSPVSYNIATSNGTASAGSDYVASSLVGQSIAVGQSSKPFAVTINGDTALEPNETLNVTVSAVSGALVGDGAAVGTLTDDDTPVFTIADASVSEGNTGTKLLNFPISLSKASSAPVDYNLRTVAGNASAGVDYVAVSALHQTIPAGQTSATMSVTINGDSAVESDETIVVDAQQLTGAKLGDNVATGRILDDDTPPPALSIANASVTEGNAGTKLMNFPITLSRATNVPVSYNLRTIAGSATADVDYVSVASFRQSIPAGQTGATLAVTINGDTAVEGNEVLHVDAQQLTGATAGDNVADGTILNDDGALAPGRAALASLHWPEDGSGRGELEAQAIRRMAGAAELLCGELDSPALVAMRGARESSKAEDFAGLANSGDARPLQANGCPRLPRFRVASVQAGRPSAEVPGLLLDTSLRDGLPRAELLSAERLFESERLAGGAYLFDTPPLFVSVRLNFHDMAAVEIGVLVLGRERLASPGRRAAQASELARWLWTLRSRQPEAAIAVAGSLPASAMPRFPLGELAAPRARALGEHLLGNAPLLGAMRQGAKGEACGSEHADGLACAFAELEFLP